MSIAERLEGAFVLRVIRRGVVACALSCGLAQWCLAFDTGSLEQLVLEQRVSSIERLLELLPLPLRSHYALVFGSRSLQEASYVDPRVVLFGNDARFIVTFNGHPAQRGYRALEVMHFDDELKRFSFKEYLFPDKSDPTAPVVVSGVNPEKCMTCHGHPARPIWDTYPTWPGVYGERYRAQLSAAEQDGLRAFLANQPVNTRYRTLRNVDVFQDANTFHPNTKARYEDSGSESPNATLSRLLSTLNAQAIVGELVASPRFHEYRYALLGALTKDCGSVQEILPSEPGFDVSGGFARFSIATQRGQKAQEQLKRARMVASVPDAALQGSDIETLTPFRYVVETGLQVSTVDWTLALEKGSFDFNSPQQMAAELDRLLRDRVAKDDPSVRDLALLRDVGASRKYCAHLRQKSALETTGPRTADAVDAVAAMESPVQRNAVPGTRSAPPALKRCIGCHRGEIGPALPFNDPAELARSLPAGHYARGSMMQEILYRLSPAAGIDHMPRGMDLHSDERRALEDYLRALIDSGAR